MSKNEIVKTEGEVIEPTALINLEKAEIDVQIATAHKFPRSMSQFKANSVAIATIDEDTATICIYRRPVGKNPDGSVEYAEGMSVRTAEIVASCYGNLRIASQIVERDPRFVKARGICHDLENNVVSSSEVIESTINKYGKPYSERMAVTVAKAALAKARRDATFQVVPKALCKPIERAVKQILMGSQKTMEERRTQVKNWVSKLPIEKDRVWKALGIKGVDDITEDHLEILTGLRTSINDGDTSIDEAFPDKRDDKKTELKVGHKAWKKVIEKLSNGEKMKDFEEIYIISEESKCLLEEAVKELKDAK